MHHLIGVLRARMTVSLSLLSQVLALLSLPAIVWRAQVESLLSFDDSYSQSLVVICNSFRKLLSWYFSWKGLSSHPKFPYHCESIALDRIGRQWWEWCDSDHPRRPTVLIETDNVASAGRPCQVQVKVSEASVRRLFDCIFSIDSFALSSRIHSTARFHWSYTPRQRRE